MLSIISKQFYSVWKGTLLLASLLGSLKWPWIAEQWLFWTQINGIFQSWMFLRRSVQVHRLMCENPWVSHYFYMVRMDNQQSFTFDFDGNSWPCNCPRDIEVCWSKSNYKWRFHLRQRIKLSKCHFRFPLDWFVSQELSSYFTRRADPVNR